MKSELKLIAVSLATGSFLLLEASAQAPKVSKDPLPDRPSHEELLSRQTKQQEVMKKRDADRVNGELKQRKKVERADIISRSTILSSGRHWTIVPKGAVLHIPSFLGSRVNGEKTGRFVSWKDFYSANRGWIHLQSVKMRQARGKEAMPEGATDAYPKIGRVVVAVCHGGPISVREFEGEKKEEEKTAQAAPASSLAR